MKKIFIIDDESTLVELTKKILGKRGYEISGFSTGEEALIVLENEKPDLIILDNILGGGEDGTEICHRIKSHPINRSIPVLMATAQVLFKQPTGWNPRLERPNDFLFKPFDVDGLIEKVEALLSAVPAYQPIPQPRSSKPAA